MSVGQVLFRPPRRSGWWHSRPGYASTRWSCRARPLDVRGAMSVWRQRSRACERLRFRRVAVIYSRSTDAPLLIEVVLWPKLRGLVEGFGELRVTVGRSCSSSDISMSLLKRASASYVGAKSFVRGNPTPLEIARLRANRAIWWHRKLAQLSEDCKDLPTVSRTSANPFRVAGLKVFPAVVGPVDRPRNPHRHLEQHRQAASDRVQRSGYPLQTAIPQRASTGNHVSRP